MTPQELERIYELTYKYSWLVSEERKEGWLPDKAYMEKAKIEGELRSLLEEGLTHIIKAFERYSNAWARGRPFVETMHRNFESFTFEDELDRKEAHKRMQNMIYSYEEMTEAKASRDLGEMIIAFQLGLHAVHAGGGEMIDYILPRIGVSLLYKLSAGPDPQWDQDLERLFGHPVGAQLNKDELEYEAEFHEWVSPSGAKAVDFHWRLEPNYPLHKFDGLKRRKGVLNPDDWIDWVEEEIGANPEYYESMKDWLRSGSVDPIVVTEENGKPLEIWDGWHRIGLSYLLKRSIIPAIVGTSKHDVNAHLRRAMALIEAA